MTAQQGATLSPRPRTPPPRGPRAPRGLRRSLITGAILFMLTLVLWSLHWHGLDYPAQIYRTGLIRRQGFSLWDANWYGGHYTPAYGIIVPLIGSMVGLGVPAIGATIGSVVLFERLLVDAKLPHVVTGTAAFAFLMLVNMYEGRLPFAFGVLLGLLTVTLARSDRWWLALGAGVSTTFASPVAGAFIALVFVAWALSVPAVSLPARLRSRPVWVASASLAATAVISLVFHEGGVFPYSWVDMLVAVGAGAIVWWLLQLDSYPVVRWAFAMAAVAAVLLFAVPNPMGGNLSRLAIIGAPVLCALPRRRLAVHALVCLVLLGQQAVPLLRLPQAVEDPSAKASYFRPLVDELRSVTDGPVRLEIPLTQSHWEAAYVARDFPLARGWERQLDLAYNAILYDPTMTADGYRNWLVDNAVSYVAVPDATLEPEALHEVAIVRGASYLQHVWSNEHWQLFKVIGSPSLVTGPAQLVKMTAGLVRLDVHRPEPITLRMRYTSHLVVVHGHGCLNPSTDGWTLLEPRRSGTFTLRTALIPQQADYCRP